MIKYIAEVRPREFSHAEVFFKLTAKSGQRDFLCQPEIYIKRLKLTSLQQQSAFKFDMTRNRNAAWLDNSFQEDFPKDWKAYSLPKGRMAII